MEPKLINSMYSRAVGALLRAFVVALLLVSSMPPGMEAYSGNATYIDYQPEPDWLKNTVYCPSLDNKNYQLAFRQRYRWAEFCGNCRPCGCHLCLQVTNAETSDDVSVTVRIIDICSISSADDPEIWMDISAFQQIDTDGQGVETGRLKVNYETVDCQDPDQ